MLVEGIDIHALQADVLVTLLGDRVMQLFVDHVIVKLSVIVISEYCHLEIVWRLK